MSIEKANTSVLRERETEARIEKDKDSFIFFNMDFGAPHFKQGMHIY